MFWVADVDRDVLWIGHYVVCYKDVARTSELHRDHCESLFMPRELFGQIVDL